MTYVNIKFIVATKKLDKYIIVVTSNSYLQAFWLSLGSWTGARGDHQKAWSAEVGAVGSGPPAPRPTRAGERGEGDAPFDHSVV